MARGGAAWGGAVRVMAAVVRARAAAVMVTVAVVRVKVVVARVMEARAAARVAGGGVARAGPRASIVTHIDILRGAVSKGRAKFPPNLPNLREPASDQNYLAWASSKVSPCPRDRRASPSAPSFASRCFLRGSHVCW